MTPTFMIIPSFSCQASCKYCFGPHKGAAMDVETARETARFVRAIADECGDGKVRVLFHGGEPLLAPMKVWRALLASLSFELKEYQTSFFVQSNLWALSDEFLDLFEKYGVRLGASLDGPRELCDVNRGAGYFDRTMRAMEAAESRGHSVSVISTLTKQTLPHAEEILTWFRDRGGSIVLHPAIQALGEQENPLVISPAEYAEAICRLFPWYAENSRYIRVSTLDHFCSGVVTGRAGVCTFGECSSMFLAISHGGDVTVCQRMAGKREFIMGNIFDRPTLAQLYESEPAKRIRERERQVRERCAGCRYLERCFGGCYYNALSGGDGVIDPLCEAHKKIYAFVEEKISGDAGSDENIRAVLTEPAPTEGSVLLRRGKYIELGREPHPSVTAGNARAVIAAHALGRYASPEAAAQRLCEDQICSDEKYTADILRGTLERLRHSRDHLNNCYLHVTFNCNLRCTHCYASAGECRDEIPAAAFADLCDRAMRLQFRQIVITGGEPLVHAERERIIEICRERRGRGVRFVLRTNLAGDLDDALLAALARAFDQVVVSVDGNERTHDERRGKGSYASTVRNCERYAAIAKERPGAGELSLACVMNDEAICGEPGNSVRELGRRLNVRRVRFRPLLPLGRAADMDEAAVCEGFRRHISPAERLRNGFSPINTCGIGQNIYIQPDGSAYPCYAWATEASYLGNVRSDGLDAVIQGEAFTQIRGCSVDTIETCKECEYRYLCGGACRAWGNQNETDLNAAPPACGSFRESARALIDEAERFLRR